MKQLITIFLLLLVWTNQVYAGTWTKFNELNDLDEHIYHLRYYYNEDNIIVRLNPVDRKAEGIYYWLMRSQYGNMDIFFYHIDFTNKCYYMAKVFQGTPGKYQYQWRYLGNTAYGNVISWNYQGKWEDDVYVANRIKQVMDTTYTKINNGTVKYVYGPIAPNKIFIPNDIIPIELRAKR